MSEGAPAIPRSQRVTEPQPVRPPPQTAGGAGDQPGREQGQTAQPQDAKPAPPAFKDPAISLSPRVAGIQVGDVLEGKVERIDAQARAVVQNSKETLLVDPAADLKAGTNAKVRVTQTAPQFLGQLISQDAKAATLPVRLVLVAVRGLETAAPPQQASPAAQPATPALPPAIAAQANRTEDILKTFTQPVSSDTAPVKAASNAAALKPAAAQATLLQAIVSKPNSPGPASTVFETRHPQIAAEPKALTMTLLPASQAQVTYARPPVVTSPIGQLIQSGRAVLATVLDETIAPKTAHARVALQAGSLRIEIPDLPDVPLRPREKIVLLSANAKPLPSPQSAPELSAPRQMAAAPPPEKPLLWPPLHTLMSSALSQTPATSLPLLSARTAQLLSAVLGLETPAATPTSEKPLLKLAQMLKTAAPEADTLRAALKTFVQTQPALEAAIKQQVDAAAASAGATVGVRAEPSVLPLVIHSSENSLIASLFLYPSEPETQAARDDDRKQAGGEENAKDFEVALTFEQFGTLRLNGRFDRATLSLSLETDAPLPSALQADLSQLIKDRCEACNYTGAIAFQSAA